MNEVIRQLNLRARQTLETQDVEIGSPAYVDKFAKEFSGLIIKDILTVLAAHALFDDSAHEAYKNITKIYGNR